MGVQPFMSAGGGGGGGGGLEFLLDVAFGFLERASSQVVVGGPGASWAANVISPAQARFARRLEIRMESSNPTRRSVLGRAARPVHGWMLQGEACGKGTRERGSLGD